MICMILNFLLKLLIWVEKTETGDKSELSFNDISQKILWEQISEEGSAICRLPNEKCFFKKAKELANKSKIIITNHSLLMADINSEGSTLPTYDNLIIDEAHHLEEQATKSLGFEISTSSINEILEKTDASDSSIENSIKILRTIVKNSESQLLDSTLTEIKSTVNQIKNISQEKDIKIKENKDIETQAHLINSFDDLLKTCSLKKEIKLKYELENNVNLVNFENQRIEISFNEDLDKEFVKNLSSKLYEWTNNRWIITLSKTKGEPSKKEKEMNKKIELIKNAKNSTTYKRVLDKFLDAELIDVKLVNKEKND